MKDVKNKLAYLNVGCGSKYHNDWVNIDMNSNRPNVISVNLIKGIPFPDNSFDVVYHSQVLEHIPKNQALFFMKECYRVLRPNGILRVVVPDLENIIDEYKKYLEQNLNSPTKESEGKYDWMVLELLDQSVRNEEGGDMVTHLNQKELAGESFIVSRMGFIIKNIRQKALHNNNEIGLLQRLKEKRQELGWMKFLKFLRKEIKTKIKRKILGKKYRIGDFRLGGEVHYWMYDRYSLSRILTKAGFKDIQVLSPEKSGIKDWSKYELDIKNGEVYDPTSLFMEAKK